jgi:hypothetical protein
MGCLPRRRFAFSPQAFYHIQPIGYAGANLLHSRGIVTVLTVIRCASIRAATTAPTRTAHRDLAGPDRGRYRFGRITERIAPGSILLRQGADRRRDGPWVIFGHVSVSVWPTT